MASLRISLYDDTIILIEPIGEMPTDDWTSVVNWWNGVYVGQRTTEPVKVSVADFTRKKYWLRENWTRLGNTIELDTNVVKLVRATEGVIECFEKLASGQSQVNDIDIETLGLKRTLTEFQISNLKNLIRMPNGANFSVPGAGKTSTTLVVWEYFRRNSKMDRLLVICPRSAFETWEEEPGLILEHPVRIHQFSEESIPPENRIALR